MATDGEEIGNIDKITIQITGEEKGEVEGLD